MEHPTLISFNLCPYVQRSVITLKEKDVPYEVEYVDLYDKPDWFLKLSPLGKVPVLKIGGAVLSNKLEHAAKGTSSQSSCGTEIEPLRESSCTFSLEGLPAF